MSNDPRTLVSHPELRSHQSFPHFKTVGEPPKSALERGLSFFADIRAGEGTSVVLLTIDRVPAAGQLLPAQDGAGGPDSQHPQRCRTQGLLIGRAGRAPAGVVPAYSWLASRVARVPLIGLTTALLGVNLLAFAALYTAGTVIAVPFYIWLGIYNVFTISQFWAFANDVYTEGQGRRLFAFIGVGSSWARGRGRSGRPLVRVRHRRARHADARLGGTPHHVLRLLIAVVNRSEVRRTDAVGRQQARHRLPAATASPSCSAIATYLDCRASWCCSTSSTAPASSCSASWSAPGDGVVRWRRDRR